jgi:hypothetical protein
VSQQTIPYNLRQDANTYRIVADESLQHETFASDKAWLYQIPCRRHGHIYVHGTNMLGAFAQGRIAARLLSLPGVTRHQVGDGEASVTFPPRLLVQVADLLQAKRRRHLSPEHRAKLAAARAPFLFKKTVLMDPSAVVPRVFDAHSTSATFDSN